jgi:hypothetical protein
MNDWRYGMHLTLAATRYLGVDELGLETRFKEMSEIEN